MDEAANAVLASLGLNTLTTSCNGGCDANSPCVIVGTSSENRINCVNDPRCTTLSNGQSALCMEPFAGTEGIWGFYPAKANESIGIAPFERVGLVQPSASVDHVLFRRAEDQFGPLATLEISSINIQPNNVISNITFDGLQLTGVENVLPINSALQINLVNCNLQSIPTQMLSGSNLRFLDISSNSISSTESIQNFIFRSLEELRMDNNQLLAMEVTSATFPKLQRLLLSNNNLATIPEFVFNLPSLTTLALDSNPVNASSLSAEQFEFLSRLESFVVDGVTSTEACPLESVIEKLNTSFIFCVGADSSESGSGSGSEVVITFPPTTIVQEPASSSDSKTPLILGIILGVLAFIGVAAFLYWCCKRRRRAPRDTEPYKPTFTSMTSFIGAPNGGGGAPVPHPTPDEYSGGGHPYDAFVPLRSNDSSEHSSDSYPILGNISADGPDGLNRLSYQDLYLHKLLRVSSRSELWLGEYFDETVVVKKIKSNTVSRAIMRDFVEEVKLMATLDHPRIVAFRGALWDKHGAELCAVVEFMDNGPLRHVTSANAALPVPKQHAIGRQIAEALAFLHSQQIVHGRLNAFNILLDHELSAKLSLFSIFHYVRLSPLDFECAVFVAPEVQRGQQPSEKADVFAFGVVLVELDAGESPEQNRRRRLSQHGDAADNHSPTATRTGFTLSRQCSAMMKDLITACVEKDPARRPSMAQIVMALRTGEIVM